MDNLKETILSNEITNELKSIAQQKKVLEKSEKALKKTILDLAQEYNVKSLSNNGVRVQFGATYIEMVFDEETFIKENPELAIKYLSPKLVQGGYKVVVGGKGQ